jgi:hypothetical protein
MLDEWAGADLNRRHTEFASAGRRFNLFLRRITDGSTAESATRKGAVGHLTKLDQSGTISINLILFESICL